MHNSNNTNKLSTNGRKDTAQQGQSVKFRYLTGTRKKKSHY